MDLCDKTRRCSLPIILWVGLSLCLVPAQTPADEGDKAENERTISLTVDYGDGVQKVFSRLKWQRGMTVLQALESAKKHRRGITFAYKGSGSTGFLTQIDDLKNEGRGANWIYRVNKQLGDKSFAAFPLNAGDAVLWKFGDYR